MAMNEGLCLIVLFLTWILGIFFEVSSLQQTPWNLIETVKIAKVTDVVGIGMSIREQECYPGFVYLL